MPTASRTASSAGRLSSGRCRSLLGRGFGHGAGPSRHSQRNTWREEQRPLNQTSLPSCFCERIKGVDPRHVVPGGRLDLLIASPECTHHSRARGGHPVSHQQRASAWIVARWTEALYIRSILIENVPEFATWGPVDHGGRPIQRRAGKPARAHRTSGPAVVQASNRRGRRALAQPDGLRHGGAPDVTPLGCSARVSPA